MKDLDLGTLYAMVLVGEAYARGLAIQCCTQAASDVYAVRHWYDEYEQMPMVLGLRGESMMKRSICAVAVLSVFFCAQLREASERCSRSGRFVLRPVNDEM